MAMNRRESIRNMAAGAATVFIVPAFITSCGKDQTGPDGNISPDGSTLTIDLNDGNYSQLVSAGGSLVVQNILIINTTGNDFIALSSVCTHQGCQVSYNAQAGNLPCPCHGSVFSTSGSVLKGPASTALKKYPVSRDGDILTITL
jgi:cytochrome b6-f complex iron-sulfur subunit